MDTGLAIRARNRKCCIHSCVEVVSGAELGGGVDGPCFVDLSGPVPDVAAAVAAAERAQVPVVGFHAGALPPGREQLAEALTLTLVDKETISSTVAVDDLDAARDAIATSVASTPSAAGALVGLLRMTAVLPVRDGLVAESLAYSMLLAGPEFAAWRASTPSRDPEPDQEPAVRLERTDDVVTVALHRPHRHNAFNRAMRDALVEALLVAELDPTVTVQLTGDGKSFCSGGDLDEFGLAKDQAAAHLVRITQSAAASVHRVRDRVTAQLHGACIGAGIEIPAFADRVEADLSTRIQLPELRMGLVPGAGGTVSVTRRIGRWRTGFLVLSGGQIDATRAYRWGLVDEVR